MQRTLLAVAVVVLVGLTVSGCTPEYGPDPAMGDPVLDAELVDFGFVDLGSSVEHLITLRNGGIAALSIRSITFIEESDLSFSVVPDVLDIERAGSGTLKVLFKPRRRGFARAIARIEFGERSYVESLDLRMSGMGVHSDCFPEWPKTLDLGVVTLGATRSGAVRLGNDDPYDWRVTVGRIQGEIEPHGFAFAEFDAGDYTIPAAKNGTSGEILIPVDFSSETTGVHRASFDLLPVPTIGVSVTDPGYCCRRSVALVATVEPAK